MTKASNESSQTTFNWRYNTCNGFRDLSPSQIEISSNNNLQNQNLNGDLIAVSFGHMATLWDFNAYQGVTFLNDLIHCDASDSIKKIKFCHDLKFLICVHSKCLNVWCLRNEDEDKMAKSISSDIKCIWSSHVDEVLEMNENPIQKSQFILFIKTHSSEQMQIPSEIKSIYSKI